MIRGTSLPVTVKTRLGWDEKNIVILDVARMVEQAGVQALAIHCRTRQQGHTGDADWSWLERVKNAVSIPVIGNGDIMTAPDVKRMFETGCDGVMIGRAAILNPWIFRQAKHYIATGEELPPPTIRERVEMCVRQLTDGAAHKGERRAALEFRKHYGGYLKGLPHVAQLRAELMQYEDLASIVPRLRRFCEQCENESA